MMKLARDSEAQPLIRLPGPPPRQDTQSLCLPERFLYLPSKGAVLVLFWTLIVAMIYKIITAGSIVALHTFWNANNTNSSYATFYETNINLGIRTLIAIATFMYPLSGFVADTYIGRYRMVIFSLLFILCGCISSSVGSILYFSDVIKAQQATVTKGLEEFAVVIILGFLLTFIGFSGYQSNYIQLGLDQLQDAPSYSLGLFVHALEWVFTMGITLMQLPISWCTCKFEEHIMRFSISLPFLFVLVLLVLVLVGWWKQKWFHTEPTRHNPYKTVIQVINFARKHKYPVQYSSFTCSDDKQPSQLDYAMERYGGPFTTEQVEDVKSFFKIILVLLSLGPVFVLVVPAGLFYTKFVQHVTSHDRTDVSCNWKWIVLDTGGLKYVAATLFFPIYIWCLFSVLRNCIPRTFTRLRVWVVVLIICVGSSVMIDLIGHLLYHQRHQVGMVCMLIGIDSPKSPTLHLPWPLVILPITLQSVAPMMIVTTILEFITAQSPYSMRGLVVGIFFAIMGFFHFIGSLMLLPFYLPHFWSTKGNTAVVNCDFGYLLSICIVGIAGFLLFLLASKRYQYRER